MFLEFLEKADKGLLEKLLVKYEVAIAKKASVTNPTWGDLGRYIVISWRSFWSYLNTSLALFASTLIALFRLFGTLFIVQPVSGNT